MMVARKKLYTSYNKCKYQIIKKYLDKVNDYLYSCANIKEHLYNLIIKEDSDYTK